MQMSVLISRYRFGMLALRRRRLLLELLEDRAVPATVGASPGVLTVADGVGYRSDSACQAAEHDNAPQDDIDQALGDTCSFLSALASFARSRPEVVDPISGDSVPDHDRVPIFVDDYWVELNDVCDPARTSRKWATNAMIDTYQLAELPNRPSDNNAVPTQFENWLYPAIALTALTEESDAIDKELTDSDKQLLEDALYGEPQGRQDDSQAAALLFAQTEVVDSVVVDSYEAELNSPVDQIVGAFGVAPNAWSMTEGVAFPFGTGDIEFPALMAA
jgi:hypothetical protein